MSYPSTDIVIPVHDALEHVKELLPTLEKHTVNYRLIFVDDASGPETSAFLQEYGRTHPEVLILRTSKQRWFTRASNLGLRLVKTPRTILLNSDCVVDAGWLQELYDVWDDYSQNNQDRRLGLVGSVLSEPEQRRWAEIKEPGYVTGHCWLLSMEAISDVSVKRGSPGWYLDESLQMAIHIHSDKFLGYDLNRAGWSTIQSHKSAVGHKCFGSWGANLGLIGRVKLGDVNERY